MSTVAEAHRKILLANIFNTQKWYLTLGKGLRKISREHLQLPTSNLLRSINALTTSDYLLKNQPLE